MKALCMQRKAIGKAFEGEAMAEYLPFMESILTKYLAVWADEPAGVDLRRAVGSPSKLQMVKPLDTPATLSAHTSAHSEY